MFFRKPQEELTEDEKKKKIAEFKIIFKPKLGDDDYHQALKIFKKNCGAPLATAFKLFLTEALKKKETLKRTEALEKEESVKKNDIERIILAFKKLSYDEEERKKKFPSPLRIYNKKHQQF